MVCWGHRAHSNLELCSADSSKANHLRRTALRHYSQRKYFELRTLQQDHLQHKQSIQHRSNNNRPVDVDSNSTQDLPRPASVAADYPTTMHKQRTSGMSLSVGALNPRRSKRERKATTRFVEGWFSVRLPSLRWALQRVGRNGGRERKATTRFVEGWFGVRLPSLRWALQRVGRNGGTTALVTRGLNSL